MKKATIRATWFLAIAVACGWPVTATCQDADAAGTGGRAVEIHGFGGWAAGYTDNDNLFPDPYPIASNELEVDNAYFTLNFLAHPGEKFAVHAQPTWQTTIDGQQFSLDVAYVELTLVKDFLVRAGKIRNPLGLYTEIYKVGTLRPFYLLPNNYYRLTPESYSGVGLNRVQHLGSWELEADIFGGNMALQPSSVDIPVAYNSTTGAPTKFASLIGNYDGRDVIGGGLLLRPPLAGLELGVSAYSLDVFANIPGLPEMKVTKEERQKAYSGSIEYSTEKVSLRSEMLLLRGYEVTNVVYAEAAYYLTDKWQVAAEYEYKHTKEPKPITQALTDHSSVGVALNYWVTPKLAWKLDYYYVTDNRAARPRDAINPALANTLEDKTNVLIAGLHFAF